VKHDYEMMSPNVDFQQESKSSSRPFEYTMNESQVRMFSSKSSRAMNVIELPDIDEEGKLDSLRHGNFNRKIIDQISKEKSSPFRGPAKGKKLENESFRESGG